MTTFPNHQPAPDDWQPAGGDEIVQLSRRLRGRKTRRQYLQAGGGILGGLLAASGLWAVRAATREQEYDFGGVTCSEVAARTDDFLHGRLTPDEAAKIKQHVTLCPQCKPMFEQMGVTSRVGRARPTCRVPVVG